jgi:hypothetical protein
MFAWRLVLVVAGLLPAILVPDEPGVIVPVVACVDRTVWPAAWVREPAARMQRPRTRGDWAFGG